MAVRSRWLDNLDAVGIARLCKAHGAGDISVVGDAVATHKASESSARFLPGCHHPIECSGRGASSWGKGYGYGNGFCGPG